MHEPTTHKTGPLSTNQHFIQIFDPGDGTGPLGPEYHMTAAWHADTVFEREALQAALDETVRNHEILRTRMHRDDSGAFQEVLDPAGVDLTITTLDGGADSVQQFLNEIEATPFPVDEVPYLRGFVGEVTTGAVLAIQCHHLAVDALSMQFLLREVAWRYGRQIGVTEIAPRSVASSSYLEYAEWQASHEGTIHTERHLPFWKDALDGARMFTIRTETPRSAGLPKASLWERFVVDKATTDRLLVEVRRLQVSPFMYMFAAYVTLMARQSGASDLTVPTFAPGRPRPEQREAVGPYFDFLPLRVAIKQDGATFEDVVAATKATCVSAYRHEIPFVHILSQAPQLMERLTQDDQQTFALQVESSLAHEPVVLGGITYEEIPRTLSAARGGDIPDGGLWTLVLYPSGLTGALAVNSNRYSAEAARKLVADYVAILHEVVADAHTPVQAPEFAAVGEGS